MIRTTLVFALALAALLTSSFSLKAQEGPNSAEASRVRESITVLNEVMTTSDTAIPSFNRRARLRASRSSPAL